MRYSYQYRSQCQYMADKAGPLELIGTAIAWSPSMLGVALYHGARFRHHDR